VRRGAGLPLRRPGAGRGWGQDPIPTQRKDDDYGFIKGVGTEELRSVDKTFFASTSAVGPGLNSTASSASSPPSKEGQDHG
jgi:hypothetical protein